MHAVEAQLRVDVLSIAALAAVEVVWQDRLERRKLGLVLVLELGVVNEVDVGGVHRAFPLRKGGRRENLESVGSVRGVCLSI